MDPPVAPPQPLPGQGPDASPELLLGWPDALVANRRALEACPPDRPAFRDVLRGMGLRDDAPPLTGCHNLFPSRSFKT